MLSVELTTLRETKDSEVLLETPLKEFQVLYHEVTMVYVYTF